jgi:hypothetical protein
VVRTPPPRPAAEARKLELNGTDSFVGPRQTRSAREDHADRRLMLAPIERPGTGANSYNDRDLSLVGTDSFIPPGRARIKKSPRPREQSAPKPEIHPRP